MKSLRHYRFQTAVSVLLVAASATLVGCGDGGSAHTASDQDQTSAGASASAGASPTASGADAPGQGGSPDVEPTGAGQAGKAGGQNVDNQPLNSGDYSAEAFGIKDEHPADFHPLTQKESTLVKRDETAVVYGGPSLDGFTLDDADRSFAKLGDSLAPQLAGLTPIEFASGNLDDDGADEIAVIGTTATSLVLRVVDHAGSQLYASHRDIVLADKAFTTAHVRVADVDADGRAEVLVSGSDGTNAFARVYDDAASQLALLKELKTGAGKEIAIAFGHFDQDLPSELVLFSDEPAGLRVQTFDDAGHDFAPLASIDKTKLPLPQAFQADGIRVEAGNFDADPLDEVVVFADGYDKSDSQNWIHALWAGALDDDALRPHYSGPDVVKPFTLGQTEFPSPHEANANYRKAGNWGWSTAVADFNGDGQNELTLIEREDDGQSGGIDWAAYRFAFDAKKWESSINHQVLAKNVSYNSPAGIVAVGQKDGLGRDALVTLKNDSLQNHVTIERHRLFGLTPTPPADPNSTATVDSRYRFGYEAPPTDSPVVVTGAQALWPVAGDFDGDSLRVRFTGKKWLELTRPRPIVILASPPAKDGTSQVTGNSSTTYGVSKGFEQSATQEYTVTRKVTLSFELPIPGLDFLSVGAGASMGESLTNSHTESLESTYGMQYAAAYPDNVVVFYGVLCMRYQYQVLGGADAGLVGSLMTIDVPLASGTYKWTTYYYNQTLGDRGSPIDARILPQNPGDPSSYPDTTARDRLLAKASSNAPLVTSIKGQSQRATVGWKSDTIQVGQGNGTNSVSIDLNKTSSDESSFTTSTEYSAKAGAFVSAEYSQGVDETAAYSVSVTRGTTFQASVGDIPNHQEYSQWFFSYGLFIYPTKLIGGEQVQVVNYWTEGFGPGYASK